MVKKYLRWKSTFLGVDPGTNGGISLITENRTVLMVSTIPDTAEEVHNLFYDLEEQFGLPDYGLMEEVKTRGRGRPKGAMTFGKNAGRLEMALVHVDYEFIRPNTWMRGMNIPSRDKKGGETEPQYKDRLRHEASKLFPKLKIWDGTLKVQRAVCDSLLIAEYCRRKILETT